MFTIVFKNQECVLWPGNAAIKAQLQTTGVQFQEEDKRDKLKQAPKTPKKKGSGTPESSRFQRSCSVTEDMLKTPKRRTRKDSENTTADEDEHELAKTPDIKMIER